MADKPDEIEDLRQEAAYYKRKTDELAGENLKLDYTVSGLRHELKQKREGFRLLSALHQSIGTQQEIQAIFHTVISSINSTLGMDKTVVLYPTDRENVFSPGIALGSGLELHNLKDLRIELPADVALGWEVPVLTKCVEPLPYQQLIREKLELPYFLISSVSMDGKPLGVLVSGRLVEAKPLYPPLDKGDVDTFAAIAGLVSATVQTMKVASLKETDRLKTEFFANISHEFRTPITLTIGPLESLLAGRYGPVSESVRKEVGIILRNQRRLLSLINQILDLAKLESGSERLKVIAIPDFNKFVEERAEQFEALCEKRGLELRRAYDDKARDLEFFADGDKIDKVIFNLLSNAVKFTRTGSITLTTRLNGKNLEFSVLDTGVGIREDQVAHVFDRFRQADGSSSKEFAGTGIGLSLIKQVVELHAGTIGVTSKYGHGSEFKVVLPTEKDHLPKDTEFLQVGDGVSSKTTVSSVVEIREGRATEAELAAVNEMNRRVSENLHPGGAKILYTDDNADLRAYVHSLLSPDFNLFLAIDGKDGFEKAKQFGVDLILSDLMMPVMTGTEFLKKVRVDSATNTIPFVMLTAKGGMDTKISELEGGADDFLTKPFSEQELMARIRNLLKIREQQRRIKRDLEAARNIQQALLPSRNFTSKNTEIQVLYRPCDDLSGDFFDIYGGKDKFYFYVADVTSHGTAAAQITYLLKGIFKNVMERHAEAPLTERLSYVARDFAAYKLDYSVGILFCCLDQRTGELEYASSNFPNLVHLRKADVKVLEGAQNPVIDHVLAQDDFKFNSNHVKLAEDDTIFCFSDGAYEIMDPKTGRELGIRRFSKFLGAVNGSSDWRTGLLDRLVAENHSEAFGDDITVLRLRFKPPN